MSAFTYGYSRKTSTWGFSFDSVTEIRYLLSIMDDHAFLRAPVAIYYHPGTLLPAARPRRCHLRYTPDFLVRCRETNKAFLVEIKPRAFQHQPQLETRETVARNFIRLRNLDWTYKIVFDDEIILTSEQLQAFQDCARLQSRNAIASWFCDYMRRLNIRPVTTSRDLQWLFSGYAIS